MTVKQIQALLIYLGYDPGEVDGLPGENTRGAVLGMLPTPSPLPIPLHKEVAYAY